MQNRTVSLSLFPMLVLALSGCASSSTAPPGSGSSPAAAASSADWSGVDPCSLVPESSRAGLGLATQVTPIGGPAPSCRFRAAGRSASGYSVGTQVVVVAGDGGFDRVVTSMAQGQTAPRADSEVAGRKAAQFEGGRVICTLVVEVSDSAAVSVVGTDGCAAARRVAETVVANGPGA